MPQKQPYRKKPNEADVLKTALPEKHSPTYSSDPTAMQLNSWFATLPMSALTAHLAASKTGIQQSTKTLRKGAQNTLGFLIKVLQRMRGDKVTRNSNPILSL